MAQTKLQGTDCNTYGELPGTGSQAPDFLLQDEKLADQSLSSLDGSAKLFYTVPSLDTSLCAKTAKELDELAQQNSSMQFVVISTDLPFAQQRFCKQHKLKHIKTLSLMRSKKFAKEYGVLLVDGPLAGLTARAVFTLDYDNKIVHQELVDDIAKAPDFSSAISAAAQ